MVKRNKYQRPPYITLIISILPLIMLTLLISCSKDITQTLTYKSHMIAHRGYWAPNTGIQNTTESLQKAIQLGIYGSEFDVRTTKDNILIICHDEQISDTSNTINKHTYAQLCKTKLSNGETIPTLEKFLQIGRNTPEKFRLIMDIKNANIDSIINLVDKYAMSNKIVFITFSSTYCKQLINKQKKLAVQYLNGDLTPSQLFEEGYTGMDYQYSIYDAHPEWISQAKALGLTVNTWTVNGTDNIKKYIEKGADLITTDTPACFDN